MEKEEDNSVFEIPLRSVDGGEFATLWYCPMVTLEKLQMPPKLRVYVVQSPDKVINIVPNVTCVLQEPLRNELDEDTRQVMESELANCDELLELEPDSKWTLYTKVLIMKAIGADKYHQSILDAYTKLCTVDPYRKGYYMDQRSKVVAEKYSMQCLNGCIDLKARGLTCLYFKERFAFYQRIELANNPIRGLKNLIPYLRQCKELVVDEDQSQILGEDHFLELNVIVAQ